MGRDVQRVQSRGTGCRGEQGLSMFGGGEVPSAKGGQDGLESRGPGESLWVSDLPQEVLKNCLSFSLRDGSDEGTRRQGEREIPVDHWCPQLLCCNRAVPGLENLPSNMVLAAERQTGPRTLPLRVPSSNSWSVVSASHADLFVPLFPS